MSARNLHERRAELLAMFAGRSESTLAGYPTGIARLDELSGGLRDMTVLGGHKHSGKSILAFGIARHVVMQDAETEPSALVVSAEMSCAGTAAMLIGNALAVQQRSVAGGHLGEKEKQRFEEHLKRFGERMSLLDLSDDLSARSVATAVREQGKGVVVLDSLQFLARKWFPRLEEKRQLDRAVDRIRELQASTDAAFLVVSQLPKNPSVGFHFAGSGGIDYATDAAWVLRELGDAHKATRVSKKAAASLERLLTKPTHRLDVVKMRGGETGVVDLVLERHATRFREPRSK